MIYLFFRFLADPFNQMLIERQTKLFNVLDARSYMGAKYACVSFVAGQKYVLSRADNQLVEIENLTTRYEQEVLKEYYKLDSDAQANVYAMIKQHLGTLHTFMLEPVVLPTSILEAPPTAAAQRAYPFISHLPTLTLDDETGTATPPVGENPGPATKRAKTGVHF